VVVYLLTIVDTAQLVRISDNSIHLVICKSEDWNGFIFDI